MTTIKELKDRLINLTDGICNEYIYNYDEGNLSITETVNDSGKVIEKYDLLDIVRKEEYSNNGELLHTYDYNYDAYKRASRIITEDGKKKYTDYKILYVEKDKDDRNVSHSINSDNIVRTTSLVRIDSARRKEVYTKKVTEYTMNIDPITIRDRINNGESLVSLINEYGEAVSKKKYYISNDVAWLNDKPVFVETYTTDIKGNKETKTEIAKMHLLNSNGYVIYSFGKNVIKYKYDLNGLVELKEFDNNKLIYHYQRIKNELGCTVEEEKFYSVYETKITTTTYDDYGKIVKIESNDKIISYIREMTIDNDKLTVSLQPSNMIIENYNNYYNRNETLNYSIKNIDEIIKVLEEIN